MNSVVVVVVCCVLLVSPLYRVLALPVGGVVAVRETPHTHRFEDTDPTPEYSGWLCDVCVRAMETVDTWVRSNRTFDELKPPFISLCDTILTSQGYKGAEVCPGFIEIYGHPVVDIFVELALPPRTVCELATFCPKTFVSASVSHRNATAVKRAVPSFLTKKAPLNLDAYGGMKRRSHLGTPTEPLLEGSTSGPVVNVLQLTDVHIDTLYKMDTVADCGTFACCREEYGPGTAGRWGDYKCDLPVWTFRALLKRIKDMDPQPDFIAWTGDNPPHDLWEQTPEEQMNATDIVVQMLLEELPDIPILPTFGNHEGFPANLYYQPTDGWLTTAFRNLWQHWLPAQALETVEFAGYYTVLVKKGLRAIVINTQFGYRENFYFTLNGEVAAVDTHWQWFAATLKTARDAGERVIVMGHVPPGGNDAIPSFGKIYTDLVVEYSDVIVAQLFGHTHRDEFEVVLNPEGSPVGVVYIAPSLTPHTDSNPALRTYHLDANTFDVLDYTQYHVDLASANQSPNEPTLELLYTAKNVFDLEDVSPSSWLSASDRLLSDAVYAQRFQARRWGDAFPDTPCDAMCAFERYCETRSSTSVLLAKCLLSINNRG